MGDSYLNNYMIIITIGYCHKCRHYNHEHLLFSKPFIMYCMILFNSSMHCIDTNTIMFVTCGFSELFSNFSGVGLHGYKRTDVKV